MAGHRACQASQRWPLPVLDSSLGLLQPLGSRRRSPARSVPELVEGRFSAPGSAEPLAVLDSSLGLLQPLGSRRALAGPFGP
jgi:hypothetical protein